MPDAVLYFAHPTAVLDEGCRIGKGCRIWHFSHLMTGCQLGPGCSIGQNVMIAPGVVLGQNVKVQNNVSLYSGVTCADDVFLGPSVVFTNVRNPRSAVPRRDQYQPTVLERGVSVGANSTIVCGVRLGEYAFVGAGSVITRDVPAYALVYGNPARQHGWMSRQGHRLQFNPEGIAVCPESKEQYQLQNNKVFPFSTRTNP
ncbi:acyltransferase [Hymenobacter sp. DG25A]|uniref:acyltransferase n=1 Tax=Hymenobacter sp. DG25A TaxID=1385663 RepID=UPI0006BCC8E5|nr:acyltransferase [Hymenobacter sp. DG25A]ALD22065.1 hexapeptide transferase [Hymenobacter sp. DG25A]